MAGGGWYVSTRGRKDGTRLSVCICVTTVSGLLGGKVLVFFVKTGKAAEGAKKRRRRIWWVVLGAGKGEEEEHQFPSFPGYLPPQLPVAANVVGTREEKEENGLDSGHLEALAS